MFTAQQLRKKPRHVYDFSGLTPDQFDQLLAKLPVAYQGAEGERLISMTRQRAPGGGRKAELALAEQLLVTLLSP